MYSLKNASLDVSILDPTADQARFGTRYCTGGYIFQIQDSEHGDLLTGPTFPDSFNTYDGQGIPDAFRLGPIRSSSASDGTALIIGVGICDLETEQVREFCRWEIEVDDTSIRLRTEQAFEGTSLELERTVSLQGRTVRSATCLKNKGARALPFRWFPHPFFPQPDTDELCRFNVPVSFPVSTAYDIAGSGYIRRLGWPWEDGHYQALDHPGEGRLVVLQKHPKLGLVAGTCSYIPTYLPIWGNPNTFSWEPFLEGSVGSGQERSWHIDYDF
ncbi:MAG: hypothetical protein KAI66_01335 [Lentisphaeria bacterium]|nr:hypothetical protein [Lentisphaeria bacterium]